MLEYLIRVLKTFDFQNKKEIYKGIVDTFIDTQSEKFSKLKKNTEITSELFFIDFDIIYDKTKNFESFIKNLSDAINIMIEDLGKNIS